MEKLTDQQTKQVMNIVDTLVEATEHMRDLVKEREFTKSIYSFSAIIEGFQAISELLKNLDSTEISEVTIQLESYINLMAGDFETGNLLKVEEILQFSFLPTMKKLKRLTDAQCNLEEDHEIIIGVFHSFGNPKDFYPEPRTRALIAESKKQNAKVVFFTSSDVDFQNEKVNVSVFEDDEWKQITTKFPDVINNVGAGKRSFIERKLRRLIPFTSFHVGNKFTLPKRILENRKYAELLVPFTVAMNKQQIYKFMEDNNRTVFKALHSNRGEDIYFVTQKGQRFAVAEHKEEKIFSKTDFDRWLDEIILAEKGSYIVQRFVLTRTKNNEPYHFRAHVQKDGNGKWMLTHIYPRVGNQKSNLSNVVNDGRVDDFHEFMVREFEETSTKYEADILRLSLEIAHHLDKLYGFGIDELGIDLAIDETGRYWMHEANNGPQTAFHEEKRAVNTIAYAKYIARNGIYYDESVRKFESGLFQSHLSNLPKLNPAGKPILGIMGGAFSKDDILLKSLLSYDGQWIIAHFVPKNIDYNRMLIKATIYENNQWIEQIIEYPNVILDNIQLKGKEDAQWVYEELEGIPLLNDFTPTSLTKKVMMDGLKAEEGINDNLNATTIIQKTRDISKALETQKKIIIQRNDWTSEQWMAIEKLQGNHYEMMSKGVTRHYNGLQLLNKLKEELDKNAYILEKDDRFLVKDKTSELVMDLLYTGTEWSIISQYAMYEDVKEEVVGFLEHTMAVEKASSISLDMKELSKKIASLLLQTYGQSFAFLSLTFGLTEEFEIKLLGINPKPIHQVYNKVKLAEELIKKADFLIAEEQSTDNQVY